MMKKFLIIVFTTLALTINVNAGSDGDLILKKNEPAEVKDCFEKINRVTFAFNQTLDGVIFKLLHHYIENYLHQLKLELVIL